MNDLRVRWITAALLTLIGLYGLSRLEFTNSIKAFIPAAGELGDLSLELVDSPLARRMAISIGGGEQRDEVAAALAASLRSHPEVDWVESGLDENALRAIYELYFDHRVYLVSEQPATQIPAMLEPAALERRAADLRRRLAQPDAMLLARTAPEDPLGLFQNIVDRIRQANPALSSESGSFESASGEHAILLLGLRSSPFDSERQAPLLDYIDAEFARLDAEAGGGFALESSGINRISVASERSIRGDANFISAVSVSVVCALFLLVFHSLRHLAIAILSPLSGFAVAMALALSGDDPVHGITLGFGFVLIGVAIDYPIHLMNHHALSPPGTRPRETAAQIRSSLLLSALTTTLAFFALSLSDFPGLRAMGTFAAIGIPVALAIALFSIPAFMRPSARPTPAQRALAGGFARLVGWLGARAGIAVALFAACALIATVGVPQLHWEDDPSTLVAGDPVLIAESERVRARIADFDTGRFVVGLAPSAEAALALNDRIHERLSRAIAAGDLLGVSSLHSFLWSQELQRENLEALRSVPDLAGRIDRAYVQSGFRSGAFGKFPAAVAAPRAAPLRAEDFVGTPLERAVDSLVELDGRWAVVTYLRGVASGGAIRDALEGLEGTHYIDQKEIVGGVYRGYRRSMVRVLALGCVVVFVVLQLRYRDWRAALLAFATAGLAALATYGTFGILGVSVNVVSSISLLLVLGMGVDYGIFTVDGARLADRLGATLSSILISCLTSVFVFGTLALSEQPALRAIGLTTGTGILFALALSPAVFVLARRSGARG
ncbi:MAG: MMPL family transporter [Deltaproteobacteria bacterium]|jgi:predicted exporter|nr:MMPL family transporter [Deltaproteobacteria bacterium]